MTASDHPLQAGDVFKTETGRKAKVIDVQSIELSDETARRRMQLASLDNSSYGLSMHTWWPGRRAPTRVLLTLSPTALDMLAVLMRHRRRLVEPTEAPFED